MFENTDTLPQDLTFAEKTNAELLAEPLFEQRYERITVDNLRNASLKALMGRDGGMHRGRLTGCGQVSTGGGGVNVAFTGRGLISAGWKQAFADINLGIANTRVIWSAVRPGTEGDGIVVQYVNNGGATAVGWNPATRVVTVGLNLAGPGDTMANILTALAASATGAQYVVQARTFYGHTTAGTVTVAGTCTLAGGVGTAMSRAVLTMAQGANRDLEFETVDFGPDAKTVSVALVSLPGMTTLPTVAVTETETAVAIVVSATILTHTALNIMEALRMDDTAMEWIHVRFALGSNGTGTPAAFAATALAAPFGTSGFDARAGILLANVQTLTDDGGTFDCAGGIGVAGDAAEFVLTCCGVEYRVPVAIIA